MTWEAAARSDRGRQRADNEDAFLIRPDRGLFVVADGMGGHAAGEVASGMAVQLVEEHFLAAAPAAGSPRAVARALVAAARAANEAILQRAEREPEKSGMGTTLTALVMLESAPGWIIAHVGDSRAYRLRERRLRQITSDHTWVEAQVARGRLTRAEARVHPFSNIVTRALGTEPAVDVDVRRGRMRAGDILLLCSDGLTAMLTDAEIGVILSAAEDPAAAAEALVAAANERGGQDNITVIVIRVA